MTMKIMPFNLGATFVLVICSFFIINMVWAEEGAQAIPKVILVGLNAYKTDGPDAAIKTWIKGSALEGSKEALSQASLFNRIETFYGPYKSFELIYSKRLSKTTKILYLILNFKLGPVFAKFVVYQGENDWILTNMNFNTEYNAILPLSVSLEKE